MLFTKYLRKGPEFHAFEKFSHKNWFGIHFGGNVIVSPNVLKEVEIIQTKGNAKMQMSSIKPTPLMTIQIGFLFMSSYLS